MLVQIRKSQSQTHSQPSILEMTTTVVDSSLLCSAASFKNAATIRRTFKFPAESRATLACRRKIFTAFASATIGDDSNCASNGRRGIITVATIPIFLKLHECLEGYRANAAEDSFLLKEELRKLLSKGKAAGVLRLVFHDAGTFEMDENAGGMNGSIVYELDRPENKGLKKPLKILEEAKAVVDMVQPVSLADMIAVAGAEAVAVCGGPNIPVQLGRIDSMVPDPEGKLPQESLDASGLKQCFQRKGFSTQELVALSGAHTLGSKGFGNPTVFDNSYFKILVEKPWSSSAGMSSMIGLPSDRALVEDDECRRWISKYANDQNLFFEDFKNVYIKLVNTGARWKSSL
ncbi:putative L-ascorbate peroxidase 6 [Actinidia eriantha]|uniref:putative L-ascorbate peroxidase 6 n=1 Tax=Actinidia eriantha TaxID=165200 RepID=UPI0025829156|nr:putative L-ascorbate peroxidase 6 [Actinidia eriantha]